LATPDLRAPHFGRKHAVRHRDVHREQLAILRAQRLDRHGRDVELAVHLVLAALQIDLLLEIALPIQQCDTERRHTEVRTALQVVAREYAEAA
jgi:hypothetical protein